MQDDDVLVYRYKSWDQATRRHIHSSHFATIETIRSGLGLPIYPSARLVSRALIIRGIYTPSREVG